MNIKDKIEIMNKLGKTTRMLMAERDPRGHRNLGRGQFGMLDIVINNPGISQEDIANELDLDKTTVAKAVKKLEAHDLISRKKSETDGRKFEIYADEKAKDIKREMRVHREKRCNLAFEGIEDDELTSFKSTLGKIEGNIEKNDLDKRNRRFDNVKKLVDIISENPGMNIEELKANVQLPGEMTDRILLGLNERGVIELKDNGYYATEKAEKFDQKCNRHKNRMDNRHFHR